MSEKTRQSIQVEYNNVLNQAETVHECVNALQNAYNQVLECINDMDTTSGWKSTGSGALACYRKLTNLVREIVNLQKRILNVYYVTKKAAVSYRASELNALKLAQQREHQAGA